MSRWSVRRSEIHHGREFVGPLSAAGLYTRDAAAGKDAKQPDDTHLLRTAFTADNDILHRGSPRLTIA
jgi:hypothetical protein